MKKSKSDEGKVFLQKMAADYYRYVAEYSSGNDKNEYARDAEKAYDKIQPSLMIKMLNNWVEKEHNST